MASKGYGCISLHNLALKHNLKGEAKEIFVKSGCNTCHDAGGKGFGEKNLTRFGLLVNERNLGCTGTFGELIEEYKKQ